VKPGGRCASSDASDDQLKTRILEGRVPSHLCPNQVNGAGFARGMACCLPPTRAAAASGSAPSEKLRGAIEQLELILADLEEQGGASHAAGAG
jgi:hypothetical protein